MKQFTSQILYFLITLLVIIIGITVRLKQEWFPDFVNLWLGDLLYAVMMFFAISFLFPNKKALHRAFAAAIVCYAVEFFQMYHAPWIEAVRSTLLGKLILGRGFLWSDVLAYSAGVVMAYLLDKVLFFRRKNNT